MNIVAGLRSMCFTVLITFLPIHMHDSGFSSQSIGFHFGLLWSIGLLVSPLMGYLSDRFGRKIVLVPAAPLFKHARYITGVLGQRRDVHAADHTPRVQYQK